MQHPGVPWLFFFFLREFIFLMSLELVRRSTLSSLQSAPEYSETRLAPSKKKEKGKRRETEKEKRETPKHLGSGSGYPIQSVLWVGSWDIKPSSPYWHPSSYSEPTDYRLVSEWKKESIQQRVADSGPVLLILSPPDSATSLYWFQPQSLLIRSPLPWHLFFVETDSCFVSSLVLSRKVLWWLSGPTVVSQDKFPVIRFF